MEMCTVGQEKTLLEVMVEPNSLEFGPRSRGSPDSRRGCFRCAVALGVMMGLIILALVSGYVLFYLFIPTPSCNQDAKICDKGKLIKSCHLKKGNEQGRYDIFTAPKSATYLVYGWLKFSDVPSKDVTLLQSLDGKPRVILTQNASKTEIFFFEEIKMVNNINISIYLNFTFTDSLFHVYEL